MCEKGELERDSSSLPDMQIWSENEGDENGVGGWRGWRFDIEANAPFICSLVSTRCPPSPPKNMVIRFTEEMHVGTSKGVHSEALMRRAFQAVA